MTKVGIVANPASGRDIRRLVAHGTVFDNEEKVNIVRRVLLGLDSVGVDQALIMPESYEIGRRALDGIDLDLEVDFLPINLRFTQEDTTTAGALLAERRANAIVTLGGDGTNRAVAKTCGPVPLMPISTGTNNTFPTMIEGTIAGLAAGLVARGLADAAVRHHPQLDIYVTASESPDEIALIDAAVYDESYVGSRAVWDTDKILELVLTQARAGAIGLSSIGAHAGAPIGDGRGVHLRFGPDGREVIAPIAPGLVVPLSLVSQDVVEPGDEITIAIDAASTLAYDGERETAVPAGTTVRICLNPTGPRVIDPERAIDLAARAGFFLDVNTEI